MTPKGTSKMAGISAERHGPPYRARPGMQSQTSNSVPSTPSQQPLDSRYRYRSPSPSRELGSQSPTSVVSEAVGQAAQQRNAPNFCKFESGAEFRKRRILYTEGGDHALGPPRKEPKKILEPSEEDKLDGDMRELYDRLLPSQESENRRAQLVRKLEKMLEDEWPGNDIRVNVFGSSGNLLSSSDSDVDICITTPLKKLESMHSLATLLHRHGMEKVVCRASAKVPIVKCWDPVLRLAVDLNVNNPLALENTRMIKAYVQLDDRVRPLAKIIKYWTKRRILNDAAYGGTISSYTWICMIISFLQRRKPPIIPSLQQVKGKRLPTEESTPSQFADDVEALKGCGQANKETLAQLLFHFFRHYGYEFDYSMYVVSVREGRLLSRKEKGWNRENYYEKEAQKRLCVEEPFTIDRNLGNSADEYSWSGVHNEIRRAFELLADGQQLEKCCEQYEFPPEERTVFQKPPSRPAPTLRRSASQSGRPNPEQGSGRSRKSNNRNQSAQRANGRRASSGAAYGNQRVPLPLNDQPSGPSPAEYFATKSNLHDQLYQQYQYLQAQQDVLRSQLVQQQQQQQQQLQQQQNPGSLHGRVNDPNGSPRHRNGFTNGTPSPRYLDNPPQSAPLIPGYLYHYPARYPPPSPMLQSRAREGITTNPSSPSLVAAVPALRRQMHRSSIPDISASSNRSQSQPGRSLPHPLTLHHHANAGYDLSGAVPGSYPNSRYVPGSGGIQVPLSTLMAMQQANGAVESAMPKEYVGYWIGQSPSLAPQQYATANPMQMPPMTLRDPPPQRQRRVTPDLLAPMLNGRHASRSPSPLNHHLRSYSTIADMRSRAQPDALHNRPSYETLLSREPVLPQVPVDIGGPLIVNGSNPPKGNKPLERANGIATLTSTEAQNGNHNVDASLSRSLTQGTTTSDRTDVSEVVVNGDRPPSSPRISPSPRLKAVPRLTLSPNGVSLVHNGISEHFNDMSTLSAPLLSPVAEMRTPSPTQMMHAFDKRESPQTNGVTRGSRLATGKPNGRDDRESATLAAGVGQGRTTSAAPTYTTNRSAKSPPGFAPTNTASATANLNPWLQATRKGHKKSKSTTSSTKTSNGQPIPANEYERKGG